MPFKFEQAPLLIDRDGDTDFSLLRRAIENVQRTTWLGRFSSSFRSRTRPLSPEEAGEVVEVFDQARARVGAMDLASKYFEAIPAVPMDRRLDRPERYRTCLLRAGL
jgi:hypothetical protein